MKLVATSLTDRVVGEYGMSQVELAAALNVTQAAVSQWSRGIRTPNPTALSRLERAIAALDTTATYVDVGHRRGPVPIPKALWEPAFQPAGRFRLPLRIEWSGSDESRWRDASNQYDILDAYCLVLHVGRPQDMATWIDPVRLARSFDEVLWPRVFREPWRAALSEWGLM
jgi:transcriptional regulator with XRE-family HTH domain